MKKKLLDFNASISDVKQVNPLFSVCKVRVLYTGRNRNMSIITKDAVEKALPTLKNIPIVGEFSEENKDYKGHGGKLDLDSYKYVHTTKPYGVVPESATYSWEEVETSNGKREYLTIDGCYLWTGRYEEAFSVADQGKGQSMEIEVTEGRWDEKEEAYQIDNFIFSALCILGDDVEPAFEDAKIVAYSLDKDSFRQDFSIMLKELKHSLESEEVKEELKMTLEELLAKYSTNVEELTAEGIQVEGVSIEDLEVTLEEFAKSKKKKDEEDEKDQEPKTEDKPTDAKTEDKKEEEKPTDKSDEDEDEDEKKKKKGKKFSEEQYEGLLEKFESLESELTALKEENKQLLEFKADVEAKALAEAEQAKKDAHESEAKALFEKHSLEEADVEGLDVHAFSLEEIEEKCYAILGRKLVAKKNFSKEEGAGIRLPLNSETNTEEAPKRYGSLFS
ncbi:hypothetical protein [Priestia megaterium]|uniref:hypothetical protein n=1 Tax=Priestia megaterium TaxID=1404 RepID=UPI0011555025|nr:hypothetical protein [Priestia megaterium]